jgi:hypothetical protein
MQSIRAKDMWHLMSKVGGKVFAHSVFFDQQIYQRKSTFTKRKNFGLKLAHRVNKKILVRKLYIY